MSNNESKTMSGNKGEWSELYAFLKLLSQGRIYAANENVEKISDVYFPILKIFREEEPGAKYEYIIDDFNVNIEIHNERVMAVPRSELDEKANYLLNEIASHSNSFEIEEIAKYANGIKITKIKAPSTDTTDISMQIEDINTGFRNEVGFSIKSEIGNPPTLFNAGKATNFIYKVTGISHEQMEEINSIDGDTKIISRMSKIKEYGGKLFFESVSNPGFNRNLIMIDSMMPSLMGHMLQYYYEGAARDCKNLVDKLGEYDPLGYGETVIYSYKVKKFLCSCALGMKPAKKWDGIDEANGGYIIVKSDGEILAYHIYNRNMFEQYLLDNTFFERASTSRHDYMYLYEDNGNMYIKLNLQIRFSR